MGLIAVHGGKKDAAVGFLRCKLPLSGLRPKPKYAALTLSYGGNNSGAKGSLRQWNNLKPN